MVLNPIRLLGYSAALSLLAMLTLGNTPSGCGQNASDLYCKKAYSKSIDQKACLTFCPNYSGFEKLSPEEKAAFVDTCQLGQASVLREPDSGDSLMVRCEEQFKGDSGKIWACQLGIGEERTRMQRDRFGTANDRETGNNR